MLPIEVYGLLAATFQCHHKAIAHRRSVSIQRLTVLLKVKAICNGFQDFISRR